jgi:FkbH-like protein
MKKNKKETQHSPIKCLVWDLDETLWHGTLLQDDEVRLKASVTQIIETLDQRGILLSIASKNHFEDAISKLKEFKLDSFFLYPQIHWNSKVESIKTIADSLNIGLDAIGFIDDNPAELAEVRFSFPQVCCIPADNMLELLDMPELIPQFVTQDQANRRNMYLAGMKRDEKEKEFVGSKESFLASLKMKLTIFQAGQQDLQRAEELTIRTNQLNATGYTYSYEELDFLRQSDNYLLLMSKLTDIYGTYGHIGLALVETGARVWTIKLLLMSCRVMSRGVGAIMLNHLINLARKHSVSLWAEFVPTDRNRRMYITYRFSGFEDQHEKDGLQILKHPLETQASFPEYIEVKIK